MLTLLKVDIASSRSILLALEAERQKQITVNKTPTLNHFRALVFLIFSFLPIHVRFKVSKTNEVFIQAAFFNPPKITPDAGVYCCGGGHLLIWKKGRSPIYTIDF